MITRVIDLIDLLEWKRADWLKFFHYEVSWLHAVDLWLGNSTLKLPDIGSFLQLYPTVSIQLWPFQSPSFVTV
jgi:hypothetical protein